MGKKVLICIDCESDKVQVARLLDVLNEEHVKANFFVVGKICQIHPDFYRSISKKHQVESHTYSHVNLRRLTKQEQKTEITKGRKVVEQIIGKPTFGFKAPYHWLNKDTAEILNECNFRFDSSCLYLKYNMGRVIELAPSWFREWCGFYDFIHLKPDFCWVIFKILFKFRNPLIMSIHPHYSGVNDKRAQSFKKFIRYVKENNGEFVTFNELLEFSS